jgi:hypothetical protein
MNQRPLSSMHFGSRPPIHGSSRSAEELERWGAFDGSEADLALFYRIVEGVTLDH